jgi:hypothetical protein
MPEIDANNLLSQLGTLGEEINNSYNSIRNNNENNYEQTNNNSIEQLVNSINQNLAEINLIQNQLSTVNNLNQEALFKKEQLLRMENDDLMKQLKELETIQSTITNKNRLIDQTNYNIENQNQNIRILVVSIILAFSLLIAIMAYGYGKINNRILIFIVIVILVIYFILFIYSYNIFYFKDSMKMLFDRRAQRLAYELTTFTDNIKNNVNNEIDSLKQNWIDENCLCPASSPTSEESSTSYISGSGNNVNGREVPGYYYYDGSSPSQLLVPEPAPDMELTDNIEWVDYSPDGNSKYNPALNKMINTNTNYYNYNSNNDPINIQLEELKKSNLLVNNQTYSGNM